MNDLQYKAMLKAGFTPCLDFATLRYMKGVDLVLGKILRYSSMSKGKCTATKVRMCRELHIDDDTFDVRVEILEADGVLTDETPHLRNHAHTYTVHVERVFELIGQYRDDSGSEDSGSGKLGSGTRVSRQSQANVSGVSSEDFGYGRRDSRHEETEEKESFVRNSLRNSIKKIDSQSQPSRASTAAREANIAKPAKCELPTSQPENRAAQPEDDHRLDLTVNPPPARQVVLGWIIKTSEKSLAELGLDQNLPLGVNSSYVFDSYEKRWIEPEDRWFRPKTVWEVEEAKGRRWGRRSDDAL